MTPQKKKVFHMVRIQSSNFILSEKPSKACMMILGDKATSRYLLCIIHWGDKEGRKEGRKEEERKP
jgi:hypothetical protein